MDNDQSQDGSLATNKVDIKQRIAKAKLKAAERRATEMATRQVEQQAVVATISPTPFPPSSFISSSTLSISNYASYSSPVLPSTITENERVEQANSLEALSKKIDGAGNFKLQQLVTRMILRCPGAKEIAESFFLSNDVQSNNEKYDDKGEEHAERHENGERQITNHVIYNWSRPTSPSEPLETEHSINSQLSANHVGNSRQYDKCAVQGEPAISASASASSVTGVILDAPTNDTPIANISGSEISNALDNLLRGLPTSREISNHGTLSSTTPQTALPEAIENETASTSNMLQSANDISARYLALARVCGPANFPYDNFAGGTSGSPCNNLSTDFSFESFNCLFDSVRKSVENMQRANESDMREETSRNSVVWEDSSDLGSPIPIDLNGQELIRNAVHGDAINLDGQETTVTKEFSESEEDEDADLSNIISSHYNCDSCRKPIVLPEGFTVSLENPAPSTCLHCKTRQASGTTRKKLGVRDRSDIDIEGPNSKTGHQSPPGQVGYRSTENSHIPEVDLETISNRSGPLPGPLTERSREPPLGSIPEPFGQSSNLVQPEESDFGKTSQDDQIHTGNIKNECLEDTIVVNIPASYISASPSLSASNTSTAGRSLPRKRRAEEIEGEAIYSFPMGPKRRRGRPLRNWSVVIPDSSPTSSPQASTPMKNQSSQDTPTVKKRGRPLNKKRMTPETLRSIMPRPNERLLLNMNHQKDQKVGAVMI